MKKYEVIIRFDEKHSYTFPLMEENEVSSAMELMERAMLAKTPLSFKFGSNLFRFNFAVIRAIECYEKEVAENVEAKGA